MSKPEEKDTNEESSGWYTNWLKGNIREGSMAAFKLNSVVNGKTIPAGGIHSMAPSAAQPSKLKDVPYIPNKH